MPSPVLSDDKRALPRSTLLFWGGVALAALAALLLLVADGNGTLRIAAVLALGSVVAIGLSITLRPDNAAVTRELLDEVEELRAEITAVSRSQQQAAESAYRGGAVVATAAPRREADDPPVADRVAHGSGRARVPAAGPPGRSDEPTPFRSADAAEPFRATQTAEPYQAAEPFRTVDAAEPYGPAEGPEAYRAAEGPESYGRADSPERDRWAAEEPAPRRAAVGQWRGAEELPGEDRRGAGVDDSRRWAEEPSGGGRRRDDVSGGRRRRPDPEEDSRPEDRPAGRRPAQTRPAGRRSAEEQPGRRSAEEQPGRRRIPEERSGGRRRQDDQPGGRRRPPETDEERFDVHREDDGDRDHYRARRRHDDEEEPGRRSRPAARYAAERPPPGVYGASSRHDEPEGRQGPAPGPELPPRPVGVVRHTETVHVTTRHTIVDGAAPEPVPGNVYGRWTPPPEEQPWPASGQAAADHWDGYPPRPDARSRSGRPRESTWPAPERDDRHSPGGWAGPEETREHAPWPEPGRYGRPAAGPDRSDDDRGWDAPDERPGRGRQYPAQEDGGQRWSDVRAGDRWAAVRADEHGRELRMGERRAEVRADGAGTELRVEDRWATVRQDDPRRDHRDAGGSRSDSGHPDRGARWTEPHHALPPGGVPVPEAWRTPRQHQPVDDWSAGRGGGPEPEPDGYPPRRAEGYPPRGAGDHAPRAREGRPPRGPEGHPDRWR
ncbi:hypothetical protein O7606_22135 [Micromonospora sp. WMMD882]|uniref:hypothetical protein n=1 Tax=Micromonospora sp. WMMD882 TaxID=3015151 RepID=UPI00248BDC34|nr:hypothetical protein [Micromonospora sp. WMMD882]WBB78872.1 hypothetical protein O7606_22135 [Micromonospora sp. WMMD882]